MSRTLLETGNLHLNTFAGGEYRGTMYQITKAGEYIQVSAQEMQAIVIAYIKNEEV